jgi:aminoglycoside 6'-N-acetyltransferase I
MIKMNIRKAKKSDRMEWMRLRKLLWPECSADRHSLEMDLILSSPGIVIVAELSRSALVGFAEVSIRKDHVEGTKNSPVPYLEGWYVEPGYRGKGIGKALIKAAENFAFQNGYKELASDTGIDDETGIKLHKKFGFEEVGRSVHFVKSL